MTTKHTRPHSRGAMRPRFAIKFARLLDKRAQGGRVRAAPRSRVQSAQRKRTRAYRFSGGNPAFLRSGFTAYFELSPVTGLSCHRRLAMLLQRLAPASGRQDHTTSPSAISVRSSCVASTASHRAFVTLRNAPHRVETREDKSVICPTAKAEYFSVKGWTGFC